MVDSTLISVDGRRVPSINLFDGLGLELFGALLTHPHRDHSAGFPDVLDRRPEFVGSSGIWESIPPAHPDPSDPEEVLVRGRAEGAVATIQDHWQRHPETQWHLVQ